MGTKNRRVAAYLPQAVNEAFVQFKIDRGLATRKEPNRNDSQALIQLLSECLGVGHEVAYSEAQIGSFVTTSQLKQLESDLLASIGELSSELSSELQDLRNKISATATPLASETDDRVLAGEVRRAEPIRKNQVELCRYWKTNKSTMSRHVSQDSDEKFRAWSQQKDPHGRAWHRVEVDGTRLLEQEPSDDSELQGGLPLE